MAPIFLLALGAAVGAWIWLLTQSTESIEEVFQTPEAIPTPIQLIYRKLKPLSNQNLNRL